MKHSSRRLLIAMTLMTLFVLCASFVFLGHRASAQSKVKEAQKAADETKQEADTVKEEADKAQAEADKAPKSDADKAAEKADQKAQKDEQTARDAQDKADASQAAKDAGQPNSSKQAADDQAAADKAKDEAQKSEDAAKKADEKADKADKGKSKDGPQGVNRRKQREKRETAQEAWEKKRQLEKLKKELGLARAPATSTQETATAASLVTADGLHTVKFDTPSGQVIVNLPDDMRAGDKISGTVRADPKGQTEQERATNMAVLTGCVIEIEPPKKPDGTSNPKVTAQISGAISGAYRWCTFTLPPSGPPTPPLTSVSSGSSSGLGITLTNTSGSLTIHGTTTVPIEMVSLSLQSVAPIQVQFPTIAQQGRPVEITSGNRNFDGNSATTNCTVAGQPVVILAESPGKVVFESPTNVTGPVEIVLKEGNQETKGTYRNVGVNLTAPKTSLLKGESTELHVEVSGLEGLTQPVPLTIESHGVITMVGGNYQPLVIQPSQVGADGRYTTTRGITGIQAGGWNATATVMTHRFDFCLQDDSNPRTVVLVNSFTGNYLFPLPGGTSLSGTGTVTRKGCIITLTDRQPDRKVQGNIDPCTHTGNASVQTVSPKVKFTIIDRNTTNNTCAVP